MKSIDRKINYGLIGIVCISLIAFLYFLMTTTVLPMKWRIGGAAIVALISLIAVLLGLKKSTGVALWATRIFNVLMVVVLITGSFYTFKVSDSIRNVVDDNNSDKYEIVYVASLKDNTAISSAKDLSGLKVGVQDATDKDTVDFAKKKLNNSNIEYVSTDNYFTLASMLEAKEVDAIVLREYNVRLLESEQEGFEDKLNKLETFKMKVKKSEVTDNLKGADKDLTKEPFTILLSGVDATDENPNSLKSDVNIVLIVNPLTRHIEMVSIPRDSYIPNLALGGGNDKLTHLGNNGMDNIISSIENFIGFELDYYVQVNFTSVEKIVDTIGGIDMYVPLTVTEQNSQRIAGTVQLVEGDQHLNGEQALALARHRHTYGDIERGKTQLSIIQAIAQKMLSMDGAKSAPALLDIVPKYVKTNISYDQITAFANKQLDNLKPWTFTNFALENGQSASLQTASQGSFYASCYILSYDDLATLYMHYQMIFNPMKFSDFTFDVSDLGGNLPKYKRPEGVMFLGDDVSPYQGTNEEEYVPEEPYTPEYTPPTQEEEKPPVDNGNGDGTDNGNTEPTAPGDDTDDGSGGSDNGETTPPPTNP